MYAGKMRWRTTTGDELETHLGQDNTKDVTSQAWRTALDPEGDWMPAVLSAADRRLTEIRHHVPDAGGLVLATDQTVARAYAKILHSITGQQPTIVLSDDATASERIEKFSANDARWMVAVRMVSEGVDVPRLAVGVYATSSSTPLFFAQAIGRFVRARRRGEAASVFLPQVPVLMGLANEMDKQRDHALDRQSKEDDGLEDSLLEREPRGGDLRCADAGVQLSGAVIGRPLRSDRVRGAGVRAAGRTRHPGRRGVHRVPGSSRTGTRA